MNSNKSLNCKICNHRTKLVINLGFSPPANNFNRKKNLPNKLYPLKVNFCNHCYCLQLQDCLSEKDLYSDYTYITPNVDILDKHYNKLINFILSKKLINQNSFCLEIGSNNGTFLKQIKSKIKQILGIDPAKNICKLANKNKIPTLNKFFNYTSSKSIKRKYGKVDIIVARHMFAHNSNPNLILKGIDNILADDGVFVIENAYVIKTLKNLELDQVYHEHMFYYCTCSIVFLLKKYNLELNYVKEFDIHGGSIVFIGSKKGTRKVSSSINKYVYEEKKFFNRKNLFKNFSNDLSKLKSQINLIILNTKKRGKKIAVYGATAKAFTMFAFLNLNNDIVEYCIDTSPTKIGKYFPHTNIPVISEKESKLLPVDLYLITAWNYKKHILKKSKSIFPKKSKLLFPIPKLKVIVVK